MAPACPPIPPSKPACVTAYLEKDDCWDSVVGWRNHSIGELVIDDAAQYWVSLIVAAFMAVCLRALITHWIVLAMLMLLLLYPVARLRRIRQARRALEASSRTGVQA